MIPQKFHEKARGELPGACANVVSCKRRFLAKRELEAYHFRNCNFASSLEL